MLLKYTKGQKNREEKKKKEEEKEHWNLLGKRTLFLDLSKLKGVEENRDLFSSQCHLHYSNCEISPRKKLVFLLKIREYRL